MLIFGYAPFLECSSRGDKRFSAFYARLNKYNGKCIEDIYQASKIFEGGVTNLSWKLAKGKTPLNIEETRIIYAILWDEYFEENPELLEYISKYNGFSDIFGQRGHACQAEEIYRISLTNKLF